MGGEEVQKVKVGKCFKKLGCENKVKGGVNSRVTSRIRTVRT